MKHTRKHSYIFLPTISLKIFERDAFIGAVTQEAAAVHKEKKHTCITALLQFLRAARVSPILSFEQPPAQAGPKARLLQTQLAKDAATCVRSATGTKRPLSWSFSIVSLAKTFTMTVL